MINKRLKLIQLSLVDEVPEFSKVFFLDVFALSYFDSRRNKMRLTTIEGQPVPKDLKIACPTKLISTFPEGTIYKLDARLIRKQDKSPYFVAINRHKMQRAIEFFDYNLKVQNGFDYSFPTKRKTKK